MIDMGLEQDVVVENLPARLALGAKLDYLLAFYDIGHPETGGSSSDESSSGESDYK